MVVISRSGKVRRLKRVSTGSILPPGLSVVGVVYWASAYRVVESADGMELHDVVEYPAVVLVTNGRDMWELDISQRAAEIVSQAGWTPMSV